MKGKGRPVLVITRKQVKWYPTISLAAKAIGVSRQTIIRALASDSGEIPGMRPIISVDDPIEN